MGPSSEVIDNVRKIKNIYNTKLSNEFNASCIEVPWITWEGIKYRIGTTAQRPKPL